MLLGEPDVAHAVEDAFEAHPALGARQRATGTGVRAPTERDVGLNVRAVDVELRRAFEAPGVAVGGPVEQHDGRPRRDVDAADRRGAPGETEVRLHRALHSEHFLEEARNAFAVRPQLVLELGVLGEMLQRRGEQAGRRLLTRGEQEGGGPHHVHDVGRGSVGVRRQCEVGQHVLARLAPPVLDVPREPGVAPRERVEVGVALRAGTDLAGCATEAEALSEPLVVGLGDAEQIGDDQHREGLRVPADELAPAAGEELVELLLGEAPHERLVVLEPLRRDEPHEQRPLLGVHRWVHRHHVLVHRELVAVAVDDVAHVVALERYRERDERTDHRVARRERVDVAVDLRRLLVAGHRHHAEMRQVHHRAGRAQLLEVGIRVLDE